MARKAKIDTEKTKVDNEEVSEEASSDLDNGIFSEEDLENLIDQQPDPSENS